MGPNETALTNALAGPDWDLPSLTTHIDALQRTERVLADLAQGDSEIWSGAAATSAAHEWERAHDDVAVVRSNLVSLEHLLPRINDARRRAREALEDLPSTVVPAYVHERVRQARAQESPSVVVEGVEVAVSGAVNWVENLFGNRRETAAQQAREALADEMATYQADARDISTSFAAYDRGGSQPTPAPPPVSWSPPERAGTLPGVPSVTAPATGGRNGTPIPPVPSVSTTRPPVVPATGGGASGGTGDGTAGGSDGAGSGSSSGSTSAGSGSGGSGGGTAGTGRNSDNDGGYQWPTSSPRTTSVDDGSAGVLGRAGLAGGLLGGAGLAGTAGIVASTHGGVGSAAGAAAGVAGVSGTGLGAGVPGGGGLLGSAAQVAPTGAGAGLTGGLNTGGLGAHSTAAGGGAGSGGAATSSTSAGQQNPMMAGNATGAQEEDKKNRQGLGGHIAPTLEDEEDATPLPPAARAGGRGQAPAEG